VQLYREGRAPLLLLSGGGRRTEPEARIMRHMALARGVPETALLIEPVSRDTLENARECARLLRPRGLVSIVLVSDWTHLPRASLLFRRAGLRVMAWGGVRPGSPPRALAAIVHELTALPWGLARAYLGGLRR
jgi:uncharacterized SAM-binding protein YcdF (DUF218 family)